MRLLDPRMVMSTRLDGKVLDCCDWYHGDRERKIWYECGMYMVQRNMGTSEIVEESMGGAYTQLE